MIIDYTFKVDMHPYDIMLSESNEILSEDNEILSESNEIEISEMSVGDDVEINILFKGDDVEFYGELFVFHGILSSIDDNEYEILLYENKEENDEEIGILHDNNYDNINDNNIEEYIDR